MGSLDIFDFVTQEWMEAVKWSLMYEWRSAARLYPTALQLSTLRDWQ
jgi:hypothetical protein